MTYLSSMMKLTLLRLLFQGPTQFVDKYISHLVSLAPRLKLFWTTICGACSVYHILDLHFIGHYQLALAGESEEAPRVRNIFGADGTTMPSSRGWAFICCCSCSGFCCCCLALSLPDFASILSTSSTLMDASTDPVATRVPSALNAPDRHAPL